MIPAPWDRSADQVASAAAGGAACRCEVPHVSALRPALDFARGIPYAPRDMLRATPFTTAALAASILALGACDGGTPPASMPVSVQGKTFTCRLAINDATREKGLGGVASLSPDEGMLFAFNDTAPRSFWMVGCIMDIDIAFVDPFGFVTAVHTMPKEELQRPDETEFAYHSRLARYPSLAPAQYALEVAPGTLAQLGVKRGTRIEFDRELLKKHTK
jgi:uncharacterized membrane protein (UPF0127 family)